MPRDPEHLNRAIDGFSSWMGEPPALLLEPPEGIPALPVLFFVEEEDEDDEDDEPTTFLVSAGLCERPLVWAKGGVELLLCVRGYFDLDELQPLGQLLGMASHELLGFEAQPGAGMLLEIGPLPVFEGMTHLLLTRWGTEPGTGQLETTPPITILSVNPLYSEEAAEISGMTEDAALAWLDEHGVDADDPLRDSAFAEEFGSASVDALGAFGGEASSFDIATAMQNMTRSMQSWMMAGLDPGELPADPPANVIETTADEPKP
jgi:hypothetical protein